MTKPIILAPAGGFAAVTAAVRCGADAVYLGAKNFNARRNAENFDDFALPETVKFCHERGTKVFVTVNTLVTDGEMDALIEEADAIAETGADAVILQDPAVMRLFRDRYPALPRHASTQTAVHDLDGALYLQDLGCETIVLARELTLSEMEKIASRLTTAGAEAFVHGAHCMSVSGACYLPPCSADAAATAACARSRVGSTGAAARATMFSRSRTCPCCAMRRRWRTPGSQRSRSKGA